MPLVTPSTYKSPVWPLCTAHIQTILPSYFRPCEAVNYEREVFHTPDDDELYLDWSRVGSKRLVIINHGLCGYSTRHYVLSMVRAFNEAGWDCLAWNYRGTGGSPGKKLRFTTNNSTDELDWVTRHALEQGAYRQLFFCGYSMGGNLAALYLGREWETVPAEVCGAAVFCATTDLVSCSDNFESFIGRRYAGHFIKKLAETVREKAREFPGRINLDGIDSIRSFIEFDNRYTAPLCGFKDAWDYYRTASSCRHYRTLKKPLLMVNPLNDPFLSGECYPAEEAERNPFLYLEMPKSGGHCGFISRGRIWWPAARAVEFAQSVCGGK